MPRRQTLPRGDSLPLAYHRYLISARTDGRVSISKDGGYIGSARDIDDAKRIIDDELPRDNPPRRQRKTVDVFLPMNADDARKWLRARAIPFTQMRTVFNGVAFRIRAGYYGDFRHEKDKAAPRYNPGFTAKEEREYKAIVRSGRRRYGRRAKEVAARTVLKGRAVRRGSRRNPPKKYETTISALHVKFFQGYAEDVRYIREADGKPYSHVVETDAAELYLAEHSVYGRCILIVDPSGKTPLWG